MKILHVNVGQHFGGIEVLVKNIVLNFNPNHKSYLGVRKGSEFERHMMKHKSSKLPVFSLELNSPFKALKDIFALRSFIKKEGITIVHTHGINSSMLGVFLKILLLGRVRLVTTVHSVSKYDRDSLLKNTIFPLLERFCFLFTDHIIAISRFICLEVEKQGVSKEKLSVIYNGVDKQFIPGNEDQLVKELKSRLTNQFIVGVFGRLETVKGQKYVIEAMELLSKEIPNIHCLIIGDGEQREHLEQMVQEMQLEEAISFLGHQKRVTPLMEMVDVVLHPSVMEGLSLTLIEALMLSKPVIATNVGGIPEVVNDMHTGILAETCNARSISNAVIKLYQHPDLLQTFAKNALPSVKEKFSIETMVTQLEDKYYLIEKGKGD